MNIKFQIKYSVKIIVNEDEAVLPRDRRGHFVCFYTGKDLDSKIISFFAENSSFLKFKIKIVIVI